MEDQRGFSLIELLIVISIILVIAAIAIPNLLSARRAANESSALGSLRTINTGEASTQTAKSVFTCNLQDMGPAPNGLGYLDQKVAIADNPGNAKSGYYFTKAVFPGTCTPYGGATPITAPPAAPMDDYSWGADPVSINTGINAWCTDTSMVVYRDPKASPGNIGSSATCATQSPLVPAS